MPPQRSADPTSWVGSNPTLIASACRVRWGEVGMQRVAAIGSYREAGRWPALPSATSTNRGERREECVDGLSCWTADRGCWMREQLQLQGRLRQADLLQHQLVRVFVRLELPGPGRHLRRVREQHELLGHRREQVRDGLPSGDVHAEVGFRARRRSATRPSTATTTPRATASSGCRQGEVWAGSGPRGLRAEDDYSDGVNGEHRRSRLLGRLGVPSATKSQAHQNSSTQHAGDQQRPDRPARGWGARTHAGIAKHDDVGPCRGRRASAYQ